ncbi:PREDICTED: uncharacterized protein LOC104815303 isoform X2 [Tarenaya hassleriana]|uniref:uncharacterized protein LOC104815303 isoform X2 n=1 Tax=Tarenaya hassleriana TaxID=28532 RepID=UPI00053C8631|nr:PREDICTED: uncharacterized protein LOC104815303 isoform X2 [Tarenaya hassleriana]
MGKPNGAREIEPETVTALICFSHRGFLRFSPKSEVVSFPLLEARRSLRKWRTKQTDLLSWRFMAAWIELTGKLKQGLVDLFLHKFLKGLLNPFPHLLFHPFRQRLRARNHDGEIGMLLLIQKL